MNEVKAIEGVTARSACVGSLSRLHREFAFQMRGSRVDRRVASVLYSQAGHRGLPAGRFVTEPASDMKIDDTQFRVAEGDYDQKARRFFEWTCGCNFPPYNVDRLTDCPANVS